MITIWRWISRLLWPPKRPKPSITLVSIDEVVREKDGTS